MKFSIISHKDTKARRITKKWLSGWWLFVNLRVSVS